MIDAASVEDGKARISRAIDTCTDGRTNRGKEGREGGGWKEVDERTDERRDGMREERTSRGTGIGRGTEEWREWWMEG